MLDPMMAVTMCAKWMTNDEVGEMLDANELSQSVLWRRKMQTNDILERLDNTLDEVDSLIQELPIKTERKKQLASLVYQLWMEVEDDMETTPADFN